MSAPLPYFLETSAAPPPVEASAYMMSIKPGCRGDPRMNRAVAAKLENPHISLFDALDIGGFTYPRNVDAATMDNDRVTLGQRKNQLNRRLRMARQNQKNAEQKKKQKEQGGNSNSNSIKNEPGSPSSKPRGTSPLVIANSYLRRKRNQAGKLSGKPSSSEAAKRATTPANAKAINEQPQQKKQRLSVVSTSSSTCCASSSSSSSSYPPSSTSDLLLGNDKGGISLNFAVNQTLADNLINCREHQGSVTPVMDDVSPSFPTSTLPVDDTSTSFSTTTNLPSTSTALQAIGTTVPPQDDTTAWLSANLIGGGAGGAGGRFQDSAIGELKIDASSDFSSSLATLEQNPTILGLPLASSLEGNSVNNTTSCVSVGSADGSLQQQQSATQALSVVSNGGGASGQLVGLSDSDQHLLPNANASKTNTDMGRPREDLGLRLFQSGLQDLYRKSMMAAGFSPEEANESSQSFHRFAFQAWKNECERLQELMLQDQQTTLNS